MARSRNIKPGFFLNEYLGGVTPHARLLFIGLWLLADRDGRMEDRPLKIKATLFPYESVNVDDMLTELDRCGGDLITRYCIGVEKYIQINNFTVHQNPHKNEKPSELPSLEEEKSRKIASAPEKTQPAPEKAQPTPADSLLLISDSCSPIDNVGQDPTVPPYEAIIDHLNKEAGKEFWASTEMTRELIDARWKEGYRKDDFIKVIDNQIVAWLNDTEQYIYLRPQTLFSDKFEGYLNNKPKGNKSRAFGKSKSTTDHDEDELVVNMEDED